MPKTLGFILITCDEDSRYFDLILKEFTRLGYPFSVNFDHCCEDTKKTFRQHPLHLADHANDDPNCHFNEAHRQFALDALLAKGDFDWYCCLDTDEVFDRRAPELIPQILEFDTDVVWSPRIELWGDDRHYRTDSIYAPCMGPDEASAGGLNLTDKFYNLRSGRWRYLHATVHSAYLHKQDGGGRWVKAPTRRRRAPLYTVHHEFLDGNKAALAHAQRWDAIYTRAIGSNPYSNGFYTYAAENAPILAPYDPDTFAGD